jgi:hypothetical protein
MLEVRVLDVKRLLSAIGAAPTNRAQARKRLAWMSWLEVAAALLPMALRKE